MKIMMLFAPQLLLLVMFFSPKTALADFRNNIKIALNGYLWHQFTFGLWPFSTNLNNLISKNVLPPSGILPPQYLFLPALVGLAVVGSFERRITRWIRKRGGNKRG